MIFDFNFLSSLFSPTILSHLIKRKVKVITEIAPDL